MNAEEFKEKYVIGKWLGEETYCQETNVTITLVENGDWIADGKLQYKENVYKIGEQYFLVNLMRDNSGYWSDGEDYEPNVVEVIPESVTTIQWVIVNN